MSLIVPTLQQPWTCCLTSLQLETKWIHHRNSLPYTSKLERIRRHISFDRVTSPISTVTGRFSDLSPIQNNIVKFGRITPCGNIRILCTLFHRDLQKKNVLNHVSTWNTISRTVSNLKCNCRRQVHTNGGSVSIDLVNSAHVYPFVSDQPKVLVEVFRILNGPSVSSSKIYT
jgi:hypothetical protein